MLGDILVVVQGTFQTVVLGTYTTVPDTCDVHRRGRRYNHRRFTILRMCHFLIRAIERRLNTVEAIHKPVGDSAGTAQIGSGKSRQKCLTVIY